MRDKSMKKTDAPGNGNNEPNRGAFTTELIDDNPYLQRLPDQVESDESGPEGETFDELIEDEFAAPIEPADVQRKVKQRRRFIALAGMATLLLIAFVIAVALYRRAPTRVDYGRTAKKSEVLPPAPNSNGTSSRDSRTEKAIEEAQRLTGRQTQNDNEEPVVGENEPNSKANQDTPFKFPSDSNATINTGPPVTDPTTNTAGMGSTETKSESAKSMSHPGGIRSQRNSETSLYMNEPSLVERVVNPPKTAKDPAERKPNLITKKPDEITLPAFASMLPVRTIGALYTLRQGALVRLELTRETRGDGWSMKRGTILVGSTKGGDLDRAYVSLIGFIHPKSGKLVKLGGDLLGGDGATGLKGKRKQLDGGWAKALSGFVNSALDITGALLSGSGRDTVVISDGLRTRTINPVTDEISGVLGAEFDRRQGRSFVEVVAGTSGYVLVTDLPTVIDGTEATPEVNNDRLASLTDVDATRPSTGLSERELAELLANGSPEQIRAAIPRMSPEMRKIAAAVLRP
jgi:hypothetical protein